MQPTVLASRGSLCKRGPRKPTRLFELSEWESSVLIEPLLSEEMEVLCHQIMKCRKKGQGINETELLVKYNVSGTHISVVAFSF
ncbi:hypothetical protein VTO42DRAFT_8256 [Malbranchea cinnamomea]